jgi:hypothetical protein
MYATTVQRLAQHARFTTCHRLPRKGAGAMTHMDRVEDAIQLTCFNKEAQYMGNSVQTCDCTSARVTLLLTAHTPHTLMLMH